MKVVQATMSSKGQVTIPREIRQRLGLHQGDKITFIVDEEDKVTLKTPKYRSVASIAGAAGALDEPLSMDEMLEIAREDALASRVSSHTSHR